MTPAFRPENAPPPEDLTPPAPSGGADAATGSVAGFDFAGLQISGASSVTNSAPPAAWEALPAQVSVSLEANGASDASPALVGAAAGRDNGPKGAAAPAAMSGTVEAPPSVGASAPPLELGEALHVSLALLDDICHDAVRGVHVEP